MSNDSKPGTGGKRNGSSSTDASTQRAKTALAKKVRKSAGDASARVVKQARQVVQQLPEKVSKMTPKQKAAAVGAAAAAATAVGIAAAARRRRKQAPQSVFLVQPGKGDGWRVVKQGSKRAHGTFELKSAALDAARELARKQAPSELVIFNQDGAEIDRHSYEA
ncbi:MAG: DUF2188 domain-containing protein [Acidobacteria bacterium]|nr:MAG: DUF2188 domain-containing protein [Acidobacteriota bacterium]